jgi:predicted CoA-binding protein
VNPHGGELFGEPVARSLAKVDGPVDGAEAAGMTVVMNRCMGETHGQLGLGPGP